jgi:hypothetical protein
MEKRKEKKDQNAAWAAPLFPRPISVPRAAQLLFPPHALPFCRTRPARQPPDAGTRRLHVGSCYGGRLLRDVGALTGNNLQKFRRRLNEVPH